LDLSKNTALLWLYCAKNELTTLDLSKNTALVWLYSGENQLTTLDLSNNTALKLLELKDMPSLYKVCVWEMPFPPSGVEVFTSNSPNVYFTTDCSE